MALWVVRTGKYGERENFALEKGVVVIGWDEMPDLSSIKSFDEFNSVKMKSNYRSTLRLHNRSSNEVK